ncbi:hypothetical protein C8T65DRAFT_669764 [Cerioporus squamosus]|nr:hypothetical protein C8T65DRAFT_669764 [Cerioporus squamosus]
MDSTNHTHVRYPSWADVPSPDMPRPDVPRASRPSRRTVQVPHEAWWRKGRVVWILL